MMRAMRSCGALLALLMALALPATALAQAGKQGGYIDLPDGTGLKYTVLLPEGTGPFPVLLQYQGYGAGTDPNDNGLSLMSPRLLENGFAILGVSLRGTGCSEGSFDLFEDQWIADGLEVIRWAATQPWSNGDLAMVGLSFPGMTQMMVGPMREPALKALLPWSAMTDLYRDVGYPGGVFNLSFATGWTGIQKSGYTDLPTEISEGDSRCATAWARHNDPERIVLLFGQTHPWGDHFVYERFVPERSIERINVPTLLTHAWQDEQISSRVTVDYEQMNPETTWMVYGNGTHGFGLGSAYVLDMAEAFLLHFMKGVDNGFESQPKVSILHETAFGAAERWVTTHPRWPAATELAELYFTPSGSLEAARPQEQGSLAYTYPLPAPSMTAAAAAAQENQTYQLPVPPGGSVQFTTATLAHDLEILGPTRVDLWLSSTASDTDVQLSLTEVRPDGKEQFVQRGWLRASHRALDLRHTRADQPWHPHSEGSVLPLAAGPNLLSLEIWPVGHVFRAGSALRISVEAPLGTTGFRQLELNPTPARNTVHVGAPTLSRIALPVVPGGMALAAMHDCASQANQPCRSATGSIPAGTLSIPTALGKSSEHTGIVQSDAQGLRLRNTSTQTHYLRAATLQLPDAQGIYEARMIIGGMPVTIREPFARSRFEFPEIVLAPGEEIQLGVQIERRATHAFSAGNLAWAGAPGAAAGGYGLALWNLAALLLARRRRAWWSVLLVATGLLAACGQSTPLNTNERAGETAAATPFTLVSVEVVDGAGTFQTYAPSP